MKRQISLFIVIAILFSVIGAYFGWRQLTPAAPENVAVTSLLSQTLPDAQGKSQQLVQWKGKVLVVNFWATWCPPCVAEMPELNALQAELNGKNIQILGIGIDSAANIQQFSEKYKIAYPLLIAGMVGTELSRQLGNQAGGLPFTVIIDANGQLKKAYLGKLNIQKIREDLQLL